jgi:ABC-type bacteriocin/lantibiotic exporter with double-glycine peptidase domain
MSSCVARTLFVLLLLCAGLAAAVSSAIWLDVPFVQQTKDGCGAASIAMVMQYWQQQEGKPSDGSSGEAQIRQSLYASSAHGIYASALEQYLQQHGFRTFAFHGQWEDLQQHLEKGRPLIVALKPSPGSSSLHYLVVAGIDAKQQLVLVNDPSQRKLLKEDRSSFEHEWSATERWTLLAVPQVDAP